MSYARKMSIVALLASGVFGCQCSAPVTPVVVPIQPALLPSFDGSKAGESREVAGIEMRWCPPGKL